jgi:hypothetical protein
MSDRIKTTVVGSYPVPSWLVGNPSRLVLRDAVMVVLKTQELAGLDLIAFLACAREAGLVFDERFQARFPPSDLATVSINFFTAETSKK